MELLKFYLNRYAMQVAYILDLSSNGLSGTIPPRVLALSATIWVNLQRNNLSGTIPDAFPTNCSLMALDLNGNLLKNRISKSLANCKSLQNLDLGNNQIFDTFPKILRNISTLCVLVLRSNNLYGKVTCAESVGDWPVIQIVDIVSNNFNGKLPRRCLTKWRVMALGKSATG